MERQIFKSAKLKIKWANIHIRNLNLLLNAYCANYNPIAFEKDSKGIETFRMKSPEPMPIEVPLILGDAIHNLRSAVDHMTSEIIRANGGSDDDRIRVSL